MGSEDDSQREGRRPGRPSKVAPHRQLLLDLLDFSPEISVGQLLVHARGAGYRGSRSAFFDFIKHLRDPQRLPGERNTPIASWSLNPDPLSGSRPETLAGPETPRSMLVVDDDHLLGRGLVRLLASKIPEGLHVPTYDQALEAAKRRSFDLALIDLELGPRSGLELLTRLRLHRREMRCVALTAHRSIALAVDAIRLGAVDFLLKPDDCSVKRILAAYARKPDTTLRIETCEKALEPTDENLKRVYLGCDHNVTLTAQLFGLSRRSIQRKLDKNPLIKAIDRAPRR